MLASPPRSTIFDGRDVTDHFGYAEEVVAFKLESCPLCDTRRDARYPFCCAVSGIVANPPTGRPLDRPRSLGN
jgi:hypothetical protein